MSHRCRWTHPSTTSMASNAGSSSARTEGGMNEVMLPSSGPYELSKPCTQYSNEQVYTFSETWTVRRRRVVGATHPVVNYWMCGSVVCV